MDASCRWMLEAHAFSRWFVETKMRSLNGRLDYRWRCMLINGMLGCGRPVIASMPSCAN